MQRLLMVFFLMSAPLFGQQRGAITGQVQLPGGRIAGAGVPVSVSSLSSGLNAGAQTDTNGFFRIDNLPAGEYRVFAAARVQAVTEGGETMSMIVLATRRGPFNVANGTYFPRAANVQDATPVMVSSATTTENINIVLAPGAPVANLPLHILRGKFVAEGGGAPTIGASELNLIFSDGPANLFSEVTFIGGFRRPAPEAARFQQLTGGPIAVNNMFSMPNSEDGKFRLVLAEGTYRVSPQGPMKNNGRDARYYIKKMSFGTTDLMKDLMTFGDPNQGDLVITLAKCTAESAKEPMCG